MMLVGWVGSGGGNKRKDGRLYLEGYNNLVVTN